MSKDKIDNDFENENEIVEKNEKASDKIEENADEVIDKELVEDDEGEVEDEENSVETLDELDEFAELDEGKKSEKKNRSKKTRQQKKSKSAYRARYGLASAVLTIVVVAAVVVVNIIASLLNDKYPANFDLTKEKLNTMTENSEKLATEIKKDVEIVVFIEEKTLTQGIGEANFDKLLLEFHTVTKKYNNLSKGKIKTTYVDAENPIDMKKYEKYKVVYGSILIRTSERDTVITINDLYSSSQDQNTGATTNFTSLVEQALVTNISKAVSDEIALVTVLTGHKEDEAIVSGIESVLKINGFDFTTLDITTAAEFDKESNIVLIAGPTVDYTQAEKEKLRKWINNDGKLERHLVVLPTFGAECPILYEFLKIEYGIEITNNVVEETEASRVHSSNPLYTMADIANSDFTEKVAGSRVLIPNALQLIAHNEDSDQVSITNKVLTSMPSSAQLIDLNELKENENIAYEDLTRFKADSYPIATTIIATESKYDNDLQKSIKTNVLVVSNSFMFNSEILAMKTYDNEGLLISIFNEMIGKEDEVTTSSKPFDDTVLEISKKRYDVYRVIFQYVVPISLLVAAIFVFVWRRRL